LTDVVILVGVGFGLV